jgi:hypothetical protein
VSSPRAPQRPRRGAAAAPPASGHFAFEAGTGRHRLWGTAFLSHEGLAVNLVGGDRPHIGAVAVSIPRPSLANPRQRSVSTSVFTVVGHKEDELARPVAAELARALGRTTVVVAGVHIRRAGPADLGTIFENAGRAVEAIIAGVKASHGDTRRAGETSAGGAPTQRRPAGRRGGRS